MMGYECRCEFRGCLCIMHRFIVQIVVFEKIFAFDNICVA